MIKIQNFSKSYTAGFMQTIKAVDNVSFTARSKSITGLLGPNGAGKSTIMKAVCGLHYPSDGRILIYDRKGNEYDVQHDGLEAKRLTGFVTERPELDPDLTVREILEFSADLKITRKNLTKRAVEKAVAFFSLESVMGKKTGTLSNGYRQRVNFAQALINDPEIIVLDEPASGLDPAQVHEMRQLIKKLSADATILISTHIIQEAENLCDEIFIVSSGKLACSGTVKDVIKQSGKRNLEEAYIHFAG